MTATRSRPMFPRFDYLTTRPVDQLDQTAASCKLPAACCLRGWIAIGLRCRKSRPVAGRESAFAFSGLGRYRMSLSDTAPLWAASCKLFPGRGCARGGLGVRRLKRQRPPNQPPFSADGVLSS